MADQKPNLPPFRALMAFREAARHDRMADAAATLGVTESAVSHQIRHLEDLLRVRLFDRSSGRLKLTETGILYLERIEPALREIQAATEAILPGDGRATVRVTLPPSLAVVWLIPRLGSLERQQDAIDVQVIPTTRIIDLERDQVDLAIRYGSGQWRDVEKTFLFEDLATPVAAPGFLEDGAEPTTALLAATRLIVNRGIPDEWAEWARARGLEPPARDGMVAFDAIEQALQVAEAGHGMAMGRSPFIEEKLRIGALVAPFGSVGPTGASYYLCHPVGTTPTAATRRVMRWLVAEGERLQTGRSGPAETSTNP